MPWAAADEAMPTGGASSAPWRRGALGQHMRPMSPYISTPPGAPVSAEAVPVRIIPNPSPKTHTPSTQAKDRASAGLTVGR